MATPAEVLPRSIDEIVLKDRNGHVMARVGMLVTLYFKSPYAIEAREAVGVCIDEYLGYVGPEMQVAWSGERNAKGSRKVIAVKDRTLPSMKEVVADHSEHDTLLLAFNSGDTSDDAGSYTVAAFCKGKRSFEQLGYLTATLPLGYLETMPNGFFQDLVVRWCQRLTPLHGYAGFGLSQCLDVGSALNYEPHLFPLIKRFPGLEFDNPTLHAGHIEDSIKGVNWLTVVSDELLAKIGGKRAVRDKFGKDIGAQNYKGGLLIQAGLMPQLGDRTKNQIPFYYRQVYKVLAPLQTDHGGTTIMKTPDGIDGDVFTEKWLKRFE
ncbi:MAG: type VI immunity family protein [Gammaproteobacteria bacterium]